MIEFNCHACGSPIGVRDEFAGKQVECRQCQATLDTLPSPIMAPVPPIIAPPRTGGNSQAVASLMLGVVSIIPFVGAVTAVMAVIFGIMAFSRRAGRGLATAGLAMAVVGILAQVGTVTGSLFAMTLAGDKAKRTMCGANLNGIGKALAIYQADSNDSYPFIRDLKTGMKFDAPMDDGGKSSPYEMGNGANLNNLENLNLLVEGGYNAFKQYRCPSVSGSIMDRSGNNHEYGFRSGKQCYIDYAYQIGYANVGGATNAAPLNGNLDSAVAIMADKPGKDFAQDFGENNKGEGFAHKDEGVNVLYAGDVSRPRALAMASPWSDKTFYAGYGKNNIYTRDMTKDAPTNAGSLISPSPAVVDVPQCQYDSVLFWGFKAPAPGQTSQPDGRATSTPATTRATSTRGT